MQKQICLLFKDAMEEIDQKHVFRFKQNKIKTKKCNFNLDLNLESDKKRNIENPPLL